MENLSVFTLHFNLVFLPASLHIICLYCQFLSGSMTPPSVKNYLSGVKFLHLMLGFEFPHLSSHELKLTLRGIDRLAQHCPRRAPLITPTLLYTLFARGVDFDPVDLTFSCAFSFAFFLFARISILFVTPSLPQEFTSTGAFVVAMLSQLIMVFVFSLLGLKLFNSVSAS